MNRLPGGSAPEGQNVRSWDCERILPSPVVLARGFRIVFDDELVARIEPRVQLSIDRGRRRGPKIRECYGADDSENRQANSPENRAEREALSLRQVPQKKPEADQGAGAVVLPELPEPPVQIKSAMTGRCGEPTSGPTWQPVHAQPFPASRWSMRTRVRAP